jgi:3'-5' exoribonuclease
MLFHHLDNLDSKMNALESALKRDHLVDGEFTGWISSLERVLMKKERYLNELGVKPRTEEKPVAVAEPPVEVFVAPIPAAVAPPPPPPPLPPKQSEPLQQPLNSLFAEKLQAVLGPRK